jgi:hypothetical protein
MHTVLIIVCILLCIGIVAAIVTHFGFAINRDKVWRNRIERSHRMTAEKRSRSVS